MKKLLLGSVALIVMSAPVLAADMPVKARPLPPAFAWNGCYAGLNVGYAWARFKKSEVTEFDATGVVFSYPDFDFDNDGAVGGAQIGCNWQYGGWIWGLETDIQVTSIEAQTIFDNSIFGLGAPAAFDTEVNSRLRYFGTVRGRLGWSIAPTAMLYVTGGFAYGLVNSNLEFRTAAGVTTGLTNFDSQTHFGWTVGVGGEAKITENLSAKLEYLYVDLGSKDYDFPNIAGDRYTWSQRVDMHVVRLGLNYQFDWYAPVVARY